MSRRLRRWLLPAGMLLTLLVYWPGLHGSYLFDDEPNIVDNVDVHVTTLDWRDWRNAAWSSPSAELRRPLAMLSFAANHYFSGLDPLPMKATNLAVHLLNGWLLWKVLSLLLALLRRRRPGSLSAAGAEWIAAAVACAWLLAPINLSVVLYVVQRMEGLAQTFVMAGLWAYLAGRARQLDGRPGMVLCAGGLLLGTGLGILCKEPALLLPLYALLVECFVLGFAAPAPRQRRGLLALYLLLLVLPGILALLWLARHAMSAGAYAGRPFTLGQRLLTELRVLVDYVDWTLLPLPGSLSFYHDDIPLSHGLLDPPTTLACLLLLAAGLAAAVWLRRRLPLLGLGICWYFAAHLMTATVIPLELVFEHRNYCASIGLLLALAGLLDAIPPDLRMLRAVLPVALLALFVAGTAMRAREWSDPLRFAYAEAQEHPHSARANYELGRTLVVSSGYRADSHLIAPAMAAFNRASRLPGSGASPLAAMIVVAGHMHQPIEADWWTRLDAVLAAQPPSAESISSLESLVRCQHSGDCPADTAPLLAAFLAALNHPPTGRLLAAYGVFAANQLGDYALADQLFTDALAQMPDADGIRLDLAKVLSLEGRKAEARMLLEQMRKKSLSSVNLRRVDALDSDLDRAAGGSAPAKSQ